MKLAPLKVYEIEGLGPDTLVKVLLFDGTAYVGFPDIAIPFINNGVDEEALSLDYVNGGGVIIPESMIESYSIL